jgi:AcrR family transcriptional regulator
MTNANAPRSTRDVPAKVRRGPRSDRGELAEKIVRSARDAFAASGFEATSLRSIGDAAGVDASLVNYYFSNKEGLLEAVLTIPESLLVPLIDATGAASSTRGRAVLAAFLEICDGPVSGDLVRTIFLCAAREPLAVQRLREIFIAHIGQAVRASAPERERRLRTGLVATNVIGLALTRYVWKVGPLSELSSDEVVDLLGPTIQRYLTGRLH